MQYSSGLSINLAHRREECTAVLRRDAFSHVLCFLSDLFYSNPCFGRVVLQIPRQEAPRKKTLRICLADTWKFLPVTKTGSPLSPTIILGSSTSTVSIHSVAAVRITLPNHTSIRSLLEILVAEAASSSKVDGNSPLGVRAGVARSRQCDSIGCVPVSERGDAANDVDGFAVGGGLLLIEGYGDGGGGCAGAAGCGCGGSGGRAWVAPVGVCGCGARTCGRAAGARVGQLGLERFVSDVYCLAL
jgi:hypothetical protein